MIIAVLDFGIVGILRLRALIQMVVRVMLLHVSLQLKVAYSILYLTVC